MAQVRLYGSFRRHVDEWQREIDAPTVGDALRALTENNPALHDALFVSAVPDAGCEALRPFVRVIVNGRDAALGDCLATPLEARDEVSVFSPIAGG
ncbi:MAG: MoaD/ThiS family protein [Anaerolineae bacterium]|nr:MoaD/ThiS family protein [Anaerolineae bacterium]